MTADAFEPGGRLKGVDPYVSWDDRLEKEYPGLKWRRPLVIYGADLTWMYACPFCVAHYHRSSQCAATLDEFRQHLAQFHERTL